MFHLPKRLFEKQKLALAVYHLKTKIYTFLSLPTCFKWNQISRKTHERRFSRNIKENTWKKQNIIPTTLHLV